MTRSTPKHPWHDAIAKVRCEIDELRADCKNARANDLRDALSVLVEGPPSKENPCPGCVSEVNIARYGHVGLPDTGTVTCIGDPDQENP